MDPGKIKENYLPMSERRGSPTRPMPSFSCSNGAGALGSAPDFREAGFVAAGFFELVFV